MPEGYSPKTRRSDLDEQTSCFLRNASLAPLSGCRASAGPNASGTLIVHATGTIDYTIDIETFCGLSDLPDVACLSVSIGASDALSSEA